MYKMSRNLTFTVLLALAFALVVNAQDTKVTMNADGSYSVIEYPVGKEVTVNEGTNVTATLAQPMTLRIRVR